MTPDEARQRTAKAIAAQKAEDLCTIETTLDVVYETIGKAARNGEYRTMFQVASSSRKVVVSVMGELAEQGYVVDWDRALHVLYISWEA